MTDDPEHLTKAGWPRPIFAGKPIPWVSPQGELSQTNRARFEACSSGAICAVCGEGYARGDMAYALVKEEGLVPGVAGVQAMDNGVMHERCVRLALKVCPKLRELRDAGTLHIVRVPTNCATPVVGVDDVLHATFHPEDTEILDIATF